MFQECIIHQLAKRTLDFIYIMIYNESNERRWENSDFRCLALLDGSLKTARFLRKTRHKEDKMKRIAVGFIVAAAILMGSAVAQAMTVADACGGCVMPDGTERYAAYEVLVETYFPFFEPRSKLSALVRHLVARHANWSSRVLIDQIVVQGRPGPGPIIGVIVIDGEGTIVSSYQWRDQEIIEFLSVLTYGKKGWWW